MICPPFAGQTSKGVFLQDDFEVKSENGFGLKNYMEKQLWKTRIYRVDYQ